MLRRILPVLPEDKVILTISISVSGGGRFTLHQIYRSERRTGFELAETRLHTVTMLNIVLVIEALYNTR